ncbi:hypothetical protein F4679DRAFT_590847 [Xylaria curta]|nr:hypothetical protein F4679DRAFT_590847 [Xylaria curta]
MRVTGKHFPRRYEQAKQLLLKFLGRWLITAAVCGAFVGVIKAYDRRVYLEDKNTNLYNAITAGLTITLSLNLDSSLNAFAAAFKWVILAHSPYSPEVFDLILGFDGSKVNPIRLLWHGRWGLRVICFVWLILALGTQVGTALIGLTYAVSPLSGDRGDFPHVNGDGTTAIFTNIGFLDWLDDADTESDNILHNLTSQRSSAFEYGVGAVGSTLIELEPGDGYSSEFRSATFDVESRRYLNTIANYPEWAMYSLTQWNVLAREVQSYAECELLRITNRTTSSDETVLTFDGYNGTQALIVPMAQLDYTTYISDTNQSCGARCTQVYTIFSADDDIDLFLCNSTVDLMVRLSIPDTQARILAGAIGWGDIDINGSLNGIPTVGRFQGSSFSNDSFWTPSERPDKTTISDGFIAHFAAVTISVYDQYGPRGHFTNIVIPGQASQLNVMWVYVILVLTLIPGLQAVLALTCIWVVYHFGIPVHDSSPLAMATLLTPIVSNAPINSVRTGKEAARYIGRPLVYAVHVGDDSGQYRIEVASAHVE